MNPIFCRTFKALCAVAAAALLSACGGSSSTVDPFVATRVIAFGDGFNYVNASGYGLSTVQTSETTNTLAGRIAERYGIVVKRVRDGATVENALGATGGYSYAAPEATVSDVSAQIDQFLLDANNVVAQKDLIIIAVGNWDIKAAAAANNTAAIETAATTLTSAIQRLTLRGAEHVVVIPAINMARTPWSTGSGISRTTIQNLSNTTSTSFNFLINDKLGSAYRQDRKPVLLLDPTVEFNSLAGSVDVSGNAVRNFSRLYTLTNLSTAVCTSASPAVGCSTSVGAGGLLAATDYLTSVFADEINLTPVVNRYLADNMLLIMKNIGWAP